jgi:uncharacterized protein (TIGR03086 family)
VTLPAQPAERHRQVADAFPEKVRGVEADSWDAPTPVATWAARDVVRHLIEWPRDFLASAAGIDLPDHPSVDDDPLAAWQAHATAVQALLDDPASADRELDNQHIGQMPLARAVDMIYTTDVFLHTWDLARATGQDDQLDAETCADLLAGMEPMDDALRASGHYGPKVAVAEDAGPQARLLGFIGRDPSWSPGGADTDATDRRVRAARPRRLRR